MALAGGGWNEGDEGDDGGQTPSLLEAGGVGLKEVWDDFDLPHTKSSSPLTSSSSSSSSSSSTSSSSSSSSTSSSMAPSSTTKRAISSLWLPTTNDSLPLPPTSPPSIPTREELDKMNGRELRALFSLHNISFYGTLESARERFLQRIHSRNPTNINISSIYLGKSNNLAEGHHQPEQQQQQQQLLLRQLQLQQQQLQQQRYEQQLIQNEDIRVLHVWKDFNNLLEQQRQQQPQQQIQPQQPPQQQPQQQPQQEEEGGRAGKTVKKKNKDLKRKRGENEELSMFEVEDRVIKLSVEVEKMPPGNARDVMERRLEGYLKMLEN